MSPTIRPNTSPAIRILLAAASLLFGLAAWTVAWLWATDTGSLTISTAAVGLIALWIGFLGLGVARAANTPLLALQINAGVILVIALLLFAGFPRLPFLALFALMVATSLGSLLAFRANTPLAVGIVLAQGALGLYLGWAVFHLATAFPITAPARFPLALWGILSVAALTPVWHVRALRHAEAPLRY